MVARTAQALIAELEPVAQANGLELVTIELVGSKKAPTIRVYLDCEGGIGFDQIMDAHTWIDAYFEETDPFPGAYTLEVSSPGIDRPLRKIEDFERFTGEKAAIATNNKQGRSKWSGTLLGIRGTTVLLDVEGNTEEIEFESIQKANVKGQVDFSKDGRNG